MKKHKMRIFSRFRCAICILLLFALLLTGCTPPGEQSEATTPEANQTTAPPDPSAELVILFGGEEDYTILRTDGGTGYGEVTQDFLSELRAKIGKNDIFAINNYANETEREILLGSVTQREASFRVMQTLPETAYKVGFVGEKLVISAHTPELLADALTEFLEALVKTEDGKWGLPKNFEMYVDQGGVNVKIPEFESTVAQSAGKYISNTDRYQLAYTGITDADYIAYNQKLVAEGFVLYSQNEIGENKYATYTNDTTEVHLIWFKSIGNFRIVYAEKGWLPATTAPQYNKIMEATVTQLARNGALQSAPGQSYVIQLEDGSFVVIDGGPKDSEDAAALKNYLYEKKPAEHAKPKVTWMFTHLHPDHVNLAIDFLAANTYSIELTTVCYNFPDVEEALKDGNCKTGYLTIQSLCKTYANIYDTKVYVFHSGQKLLLPGCEIEFLYTQEDHWPHTFQTANDTSAVWRMTFTGGNSFLVLGDSERTPCRQITAIYGNYLKSDVLQPSHHGFNGAILEIYQAIDPSICLWPVDGVRFAEDPRCLGTSSGYSFNDFLRNQGNRKHYHASKTVTIVMSSLTVIE